MAVVGIFAAVQLGADMIRNDFKMNIGEIGMSVGLGALQGALAASGAGGLAAYAGKNAGLLTLGSAVAGQINIPVIESENFSLSVSPSLSAGTNGIRLGANAIAGVRAGRASFSMGYSLGRNFSATDLSQTMSEAKWSSNYSTNMAWVGNGWGASIGSTTFGGNYQQTVANYGLSAGRFSLSVQNDWGPAGDQEDRFRSAGLKLSYQVNDDLALNAGFSLWTGAPDGETGTYTTARGNQREYYLNENPSALRNGNLFGGVTYRGNSYHAGYNSEGIRSGIQNNYHSIIGSPHFTRMQHRGAFYSSYGAYNPFTIYSW